MKVGEYFILRTDTGTYIIAHESGEAMEISEEQFVEAIRDLWDEEF